MCGGHTIANLFAMREKFSRPYGRAIAQVESSPMCRCDTPHHCNGVYVHYMSMGPFRDIIMRPHLSAAPPPVALIAFAPSPRLPPPHNGIYMQLRHFNTLQTACDPPRSPGALSAAPPVPCPCPPAVDRPPHPRGHPLPTHHGPCGHHVALCADGGGRPGLHMVAQGEASMGRQGHSAIYALRASGLSNV